MEFTNRRQRYRELEFIPLTSINERSFDTILTNPLGGFTMQWEPVKVNNVFADVKWFFPKLKYGHILTVPLEYGDKPKCAYFVKDLNRIPMCYTVMTSSDTKFFKEQRVLIEDMATCREAVSWCEEHLEHSEFSHNLLRQMIVFTLQIGQFVVCLY